MAFDESIERAGRIETGQAADFLDGEMTPVTKQCAGPLEQPLIAPGPEMQTGLLPHDGRDGVAVNVKADRKIGERARRILV
jgi:hypothetical protein